MGSVTSLRSSPRAAGPPDSVRSIASRLGDGALVRALQSGDRSAAGELFDRHAPRVHKVLLRVLGPDAELGDLVQDVFVHALRDVGELREPEAVGGWLVGIAVHVARRTIRTRSRWRWIRPTTTGELPEVGTGAGKAEASRQLATVYRVLERLPTDERLAFCLRHIDGMELTEGAEACGVSLATFKRRLQRAQQEFRDRARSEPALAGLVAEGETP